MAELSGRQTSCLYLLLFWCYAKVNISNKKVRVKVRVKVIVKWGHIQLTKTILTFIG